MQTNHEINLINTFKKTGNIELLSEVYRPYMTLVYGVCMKYLKNREQAQDAVMDIFEKLISEFSKHPAPDNFKTWLYVVAKNFCLMQLRHGAYENKAFKKMSDDFMDNGFSVHPLDEEEALDKTPALNKCMEQLKEQQRRAIELFYYKKLCYKEISDALKVPEKTIKSDIQNGKRNLKICIENNT